MNTTLNIVSSIVGGALVVTTLWSAMLTVVVPRAERPWITQYHFRLLGLFAVHVGRRIPSPEQRDRFESRMAPFALASLPFVWAAHITVGFALVFWRNEGRSFVDAIMLSGSSLTTLGIRTADGTTTLLLVVIEALIGLGLVGLMISYLPTIYTAYTDREIAVARLEVRAGRPPHPVTFLERTHTIGWLEQMDMVWAEWEEWFLEIEETHTTHASLSFFRSAYYGRSWLIAASTVLDAAAMIVSTVDTDVSPRASLCIRSGFTTLRSIADVFDVDYAQDPAPDEPISIDRSAYDALCLELSAKGLPLRADLDQAWRDFAGWRVNYDAALRGLLQALRLDNTEWFEDGRLFRASDADI